MGFLSNWTITKPAAGTDELFAPDPAHVTASSPRTLWIELTSKCPFDCVFCSRKSRFGQGRHMDFSVYQSIIRDLDNPDFIGLNYSGESIYYPRLLEAIDLAVDTGAATELVTAFSSISSRLLSGIVESRLDRLAISLHTMDADQYKAIYQFSSLSQLKERIDEFLGLRRTKGTQSPRLDFCFVALAENLSQLAEVAAYAKQVEVREIFIHPIIGRHPIPYDFPKELAGTHLTGTFKADLREAVSHVQMAHPELALTILNPDVEANPQLDHVPRYFAPALPESARIHSCDQNPWETVHILAGGDVVVCEVHDQILLGNLHHQTLREIWTGEQYREFRRKYSAGSISQCRDCPWKTAYIPSPWKSVIRGTDKMSPQLLRGWYIEEEGTSLWSKRESSAVLKNLRDGNQVRIAGILPHSIDSSQNMLRVECNGVRLGEITNNSSKFQTFDVCLEMGQAAADLLNLTFVTQSVFRPSATGCDSDTRDLGFALSRLEALSRSRKR